MVTTISPILADHAVVGPPQGQWAEADWEALPADEYVYEILDGWLYMTTAPSFFHQWIVSMLIEQIGIPAKQQGLGVWATAPIGVILAPQDAVQPDFVFVAQERLGIIRQRRIRGAPDLVVEVLSPGNSSEEMERKRASYARGGVAHYAEVNPSARALLLYRLDAAGSYSPPATYGEADTVVFPCLPTLELVVGDLFVGAPDIQL